MNASGGSEPTTRRAVLARGLGAFALGLIGGHLTVPEAEARAGCQRRLAECKQRRRELRAMVDEQAAQITSLQAELSECRGMGVASTVDPAAGATMTIRDGSEGSETITRGALLAQGLSAFGISLIGGQVTVPEAEARAGCQRRLAECKRRRRELRAMVDEQAAQITSLQAELTECRATSGPAWGACPTAGATAAETLAKWPGMTSIRLFTPTDAGPPAVLPDVRVISWSNKPLGSGYYNPSINVPTNTDDFIWTPWQEVDLRVNRGEITLAEWRAVLDRIASQGLPPKVRLSVITTAWGIATGPGSGNRDWHQFDHDALTEWGADFDGIPASATSYHNEHYLRALDTLDDIRAAGYRISVPEFGAPLAPWDPTGTARAEWFAQWAQRFKDFGMHYVCLFDHPNDGYTVNDAASIEAWRNVIQGGT